MTDKSSIFADCCMINVKDCDALNIFGVRCSQLDIMAFVTLSLLGLKVLKVIE